MEKMADELMGNEILGQLSLEEPLKEDKEEKGKKAAEWTKEVLSKVK